MDIVVTATTATATAVWANATRTLTGFGAAVAVTRAVNQVIGATSTITFAVSATQVSVNSFAALANAGGTILVQFTDGTNTWTVSTIAISTAGGQDTSVSRDTVFWQLHNNSATAATWWSNGFIYQV